ncbi:Glycosyl transferase involved in cell wall bisynthesis [Pseudomonas syringae pv. actinidiae]|uniref:Glycosyl transferase involved in cell wall bisynthesis n=1 Tax=Pseudomonas syringae pv. actinidiae TaxID=103796 RepID=A0AAN4TPE5_PSESF|nr:Glycosyl transferase involved in cell wall bisynthesis [Pseudomonas syringae pv. actinidiae]
MRKLEGQSFGQENILLRPAIGGQVVDDSQQWVVRGYAHGVHSIHKP